MYSDTAGLMLRRTAGFAFSQIDQARRLAGSFMDACGCGPQESPFRIAAEFAGVKLRIYGERSNGSPLLIIPAPFKRPYIWDLRPDVSAVRRFLSRGFRVYMLEWSDAKRSEDDLGLDAYALELPSRAMAVIAAETGQQSAIVAGHSLGGTFAAIFAALNPRQVDRLILIEAPLAFGECGGPLARWARSGPHPRAILAVAGSPVAGSVLNLLSMSAAPEAFHWRRLSDFLASAGDSNLMLLHALVERWTLDEFALPGRLFVDVVDELYRKDGLIKGTLRICGRRVGLVRLAMPVLAIVNPESDVVPALSALGGLDHPIVLAYKSETGTALDHLGPLVGPKAHALIWPHILDFAEHLSETTAA